MLYGICYSHPDHGSDRLGIDFKTIKAAWKHIAEIRTDPSKFGWCEWLKDASLWVVDDEGNLM